MEVPVPFSVFVLVEGVCVIEAQVPKDETHTYVHESIRIATVYVPGPPRVEEGGPVG